MNKLIQFDEDIHLRLALIRKYWLDEHGEWVMETADGQGTITVSWHSTRIEWKDKKIFLGDLFDKRTYIQEPLMWQILKIPWAVTLQLTEQAFKILQEKSAMVEYVMPYMYCSYVDGSCVCHDIAVNPHSLYAVVDGSAQFVKDLCKDIGLQLTQVNDHLYVTTDTYLANTDACAVYGINPPASGAAVSYYAGTKFAPVLMEWINQLEQVSIAELDLFLQNYRKGYGDNETEENE